MAVIAAIDALAYELCPIFAYLKSNKEKSHGIRETAITNERGEKRE